MSESTEVGVIIKCQNVVHLHACVHRFFSTLNEEGGGGGKSAPPPHWICVFWILEWSSHKLSSIVGCLELSLNVSLK